MLGRSQFHALRRLRGTCITNIPRHFYQDGPMPRSRVSAFLIQRLQHCRPIQLNIQYLWSSEIMRFYVCCSAVSPLLLQKLEAFLCTPREALWLSSLTCEWSLVLCYPPHSVKIPLSNTSNHLTSLLPCGHFLLVPFMCLNFHLYKGIYPQ